MSDDHPGLDPPSSTNDTSERQLSGTSEEILGRSPMRKARSGRRLSNSSAELSGICAARKGRSGRRLPGNRNNSSIRGMSNRSDASSGAISVSTMESFMTEGAQARAREDLMDDGEGGDKMPSNPWFCYRLILAGMLATLVLIVSFMASCRSFRFDSWDDGVQYYGIRGVSEPFTDRCVPWETQEMIDWNKYWTDERLPMLFVTGIAGITFVVTIAVSWVVYGVVLKSKRDRKKNRGDPAQENDKCGGPIGPAVIIGVCLIGAGLTVFVTIMGNCANIPPMNYSDQGLKCNLHTWSSLALVASIALCSMGGSLAFFLKCCCNRCFFTTYLRKQLVEP